MEANDVIHLLPLLFCTLESIFRFGSVTPFFHYFIFRFVSSFAAAMNFSFILLFHFERQQKTKETSKNTKRNYDKKRRRKKKENYSAVTIYRRLILIITFHHRQQSPIVIFVHSLELIISFFYSVIRSPKRRISICTREMFSSPTKFFFRVKYRANLTMIRFDMFCRSLKIIKFIENGVVCRISLMIEFGRRLLLFLL